MGARVLSFVWLDPALTVDGARTAETKHEYGSDCKGPGDNRSAPLRKLAEHACKKHTPTEEQHK